MPAGYADLDALGQYEFIEGIIGELWGQGAYFELDCDGGLWEASCPMEFHKIETSYRDWECACGACQDEEEEEE